MAQIKYITVKGSNTFGSTPFYIGVPQHERAMTKRETYAYLADRTGYRAAAIKAAFLALAAYCRENADKGNITLIDGVASIRNTVRGSFDSLTGPWVKGRNYLFLNAVELEPFKTVLAGIVPSNKTEGARPVINTVYDDVEGVYDVIKGVDGFSIAGADLAPDATKDDEYVAFLNAQGNEVGTVEIDFSDLQNVKGHLTTAIPAGEYTLAVFTRSGLGAEFGVAKATRRITVAA